MHRLLKVSLSAALISAKLTGAAQAAYSPEQFATLERLIEAGSWVDLRAYLIANPELLQFGDAISSELQRFLLQTSDLYTSLTFTPDMFPDLTATNTLGRPPLDPTDELDLADLGLGGPTPLPETSSSEQDPAAPLGPTIY